MDTSDEHLPYISATGSGSRYQQIACDLASKIADGTYPEGQGCGPCAGVEPDGAAVSGERPNGKSVVRSK